MAQPVSGEAWDDARIGMNVAAYDESFDVGGPNVLDLAPVVIEENRQLAAQVVELAREAAALEREIERLRSQGPA